MSLSEYCERFAFYRTRFGAKTHVFNRIIFMWKIIISLYFVNRDPKGDFEVDQGQATP